MNGNDWILCGSKLTCLDSYNVSSMEMECDVVAFVSFFEETSKQKPQWMSGISQLNMQPKLNFVLRLKANGMIRVNWMDSKKTKSHHLEHGAKLMFSYDNAVFSHRIFWLQLGIRAKSWGRWKWWREASSVGSRIQCLVLIYCLHLCSCSEHSNFENRNVEIAFEMVMDKSRCIVCFVEKGEQYWDWGSKRVSGDREGDWEQEWERTTKWL